MIAVDTNIISTLLRGESCELPSSELYVPFMVVAELRAGVAAGDNPPKNQSILDTFLLDENVTLSPGLTPEMIPCYTQIYSYLRKQGTPISPNDLWIAAECMQLSLPLLTRDKDFNHVPQIMLVS
jgi:predicted nucleic acid-binding protein